MVIVSSMYNKSLEFAPALAGPPPDGINGVRVID